MIYFDNNATTPLAPEVIEVCAEALHTFRANPSSAHKMGKQAAHELNLARKTISSFLKVAPQEIFFTSGATEGLNTLIYGLIPQDAEVISTRIEHKSVLIPLQSRTRFIRYVEVGLEGCPAIDAIEALISQNTKALVFSWVNSETGSKIDIEALASLARKHALILIIDGVAILGKEEISIPEGVSAIAFSGHKFHAPKGVGFCYLSNKLQLCPPLILGGLQEMKRRAGTENSLGIQGLAKAVELLENQKQFSSDMESMRNTFESLLFSEIGNISIHGKNVRVCNTSNVCFHGIDGESLFILLDQSNIFVSLGSACSSGALEPSHVLREMGIPLNNVKSSIRFSFSRFNNLEEIKLSVEKIKASCLFLRS